MNTVTSVLEEVRDELIKIDIALIKLGRLEWTATGNTVKADDVTKGLNRIAYLLGLVSDSTE